MRRTWSSAGAGVKRAALCERCVIPTPSDEESNDELESFFRCPFDVGRSGSQAGGTIIFFSLLRGGSGVVKGAQ